MECNAMSFRATRTDTTIMHVLHMYSLTPEWLCPCDLGKSTVLPYFATSFPSTPFVLLIIEGPVLRKLWGDPETVQVLG